MGCDEPTGECLPSTRQTLDPVPALQKGRLTTEKGTPTAETPASHFSLGTSKLGGTERSASASETGKHIRNGKTVKNTWLSCQFHSEVVSSTSLYQFDTPPKNTERKPVRKTKKIWQPSISRRHNRISSNVTFYVSPRYIVCCLFKA